MNRLTSRIYYGWVVVGVAFVTLAIGGSTNSSFGIFYVAILKDLGGSRSSTAFAFSLAMLVFGVSGSLIGRAIDRFGPRLVVPVGVVILSVGLYSSSQVTALWQLYLLYGVVTAFGITALGYIPVTTTAANWFQERRATAVGIALSGRGVGAVLLIPFYQHLISAYGWRSAYIIMGSIIVVSLCPLNLFLQRPFPKEGVVAELESAKAAKRGKGSNRRVEVVDEQWAATEWTVRRALRTRRLWMQIVMGLFAGVNFSTIGVHQAQHIVDSGFSAMLAASILGLLGIVRSVGGVLGGIVSDRIGREGAYTVGVCLSILGVYLLLSVGRGSEVIVLYLYVVCYGLGNGMSSSVGASAQTDIWQGRHLGAVLGMLVIGSGVGGAIGPWLAGYIFDRWQTYTPAFALVMVLLAANLVFIWLVAPRKVRRIGGQRPAGAAKEVADAAT